MVLLHVMAEVRPQASDDGNALYNIHEYTLSVQGENPLLQTGVFYDYSLYNTEGHPFIFTNAFYNGHVVYKNRTFHNVKLKYDIFQQHLYVNHPDDEGFTANRLADEFLSEFSVIGLHFKKIADQQGNAHFYQLVAESGSLSCYYAWFKTQGESHEGAYKKIVFSEDKQRRYLVRDNEMHRYKNNRTFLRLFPEHKKDIRRYLKENEIKTGQADDEEMISLLQYCSDLLTKI